MDIQYRAKKLAQDIIQVLSSCSVDFEKFQAVHAPIDFGKNADNYISECLKTTWVSTGGSYVKKFADKLSNYIDVPFVVPVSSGTAALKLALISLDIKKDEEVLVPSFTFVASANCVSHIGAIPHFVDIESNTLGIDPVKLDNYLSKKVIFKNNQTINKETGAKITALIAVHIYGNCCNILEISKICKKFNIKLIEDCAGALGTFGKKGGNLYHVGRFGKLGCLSFNGNKIVTTGGGGAIFTESKDLYQKLLHLSTTARISHPYEIEHDQIGWNDRMPNLNAALGLSQLEIFQDTLERKQKIHKIYKKKFLQSNLCSFVEHNQYCKSNYWLNSILINEKQNLDYFKNILYEELIAKNIQIRAGWKPLNCLNMYKNNPSDECSKALDISSRIINLPSIF